MPEDNEIDVGRGLMMKSKSDKDSEIKYKRKKNEGNICTQSHLLACQREEALQPDAADMRHKYPNDLQQTTCSNSRMMDIATAIRDFTICC